jgi:hypothetical protein
MATTTPNFGWPVPTSTDLVKDGATAIESLGDSIDASLLDLKGGTSGQVLKKNSNTDMDFVWSADSAGMTNPMTTTGDIIYSSSGSTPARLGIGTSGQVVGIAAGVPAWVTPVAGGMTELATGSLSGTTTTITSISGAYKNLVIRLDSPDVSANTNVLIRFNGDSGANNYRYVSIYSDQYNIVQNSGADNSLALITTLAADGNNAAATMTIFDYADSTQYKPIEYCSVYKFATSGVLRCEGGFGGYVQPTAITSVAIIAGSSNTLTGTYFIYGVN